MKITRQKLSLPLMVLAALLMFANSCKKDDGNSAESGTVKDIDGNVYHTVTIGTQVWMVENLKTTKYRNGDAIPAYPAEGIYDAAFYKYSSDSMRVGKSGAFYNWYAVKDSRGIAPEGWHVPTDSEWTTLTTYVSANTGTSGFEAKALAATTGWISETLYANSIGNDLTKNNSSGFTALPGLVDGQVTLSYNEAGSWWSSTVFNIDMARCRFLLSDWSIMDKDDYWTRCEKVDLLSVRCVRD